MLDYRQEFTRTTRIADERGAVVEKHPHEYQERLAALLFQRRHTIVRAPTGAGKTLSVLVPFLLDRKQIGVSSLIYVLPLRTLVEAVYKEACELAKPLNLTVRMQTGEYADAEFFHDADIIVTTFDQLLSGLLCEPYGLSSRLWNINAAAMAGKMIVFDEFHLMGPADAFVTAILGAEMFKHYCVSVWMTATATTGLTDVIRTRLNAAECEFSPDEQTALFEGRGISRSLRLQLDRNVTAAEVVKYRDQRTLVVVNTVRRAQDLFIEVKKLGLAPLLLHSRFFSSDRKKKQSELASSRLVIATQVIEAGVDITSEVLLTELAPVNSLVQRAGRCARFKGESGTVHVFDVPSHLPYSKESLNLARNTIGPTDSLNPATCYGWVERAHAQEDRETLRGLTKMLGLRRDLIKRHITGDDDFGASEYIRPGTDSVRVFVLADPNNIKPQEREAISLRRADVSRHQSQAWTFEGDGWQYQGLVQNAYAVALPPSIAGYTVECGLVLERAGSIESPSKSPRGRPGYSTLSVEPWVSHTLAVIEESRRRLDAEGIPKSLVNLAVSSAQLHDLGKLQRCWQEWAVARQAARGKTVEEALAHTDFDWRLHRGEPKPPHHSAASARFGEAYLSGLSEPHRLAILLSVISHHGASIGGSAADKPHAWAHRAAVGIGLSKITASESSAFFTELREDVIERFDDVWPLAAILSRILRLSDQKATAEGTSD